jgi:Zn-dependent protease with chaperone function
MTTIEGQFLDGVRPTVIQGRLEFTDRHALLVAGGTSRKYANTQLFVSPRTGSADRFISFPDGTQFVCADQPLLDALPQESPSEGIVAWLENRWKVALGCVVAVVCLLLAGYFWGLPILAKGIAEQIPMETEQAMGVQVLSWFDENEWVQPAETDVFNQQKIREGFGRLCDDLPHRDFYRLEFRSSRYFGPNAFALPGGIVVVTDDLIEVSETYDEIMAVMAHEIGHVELRHATRSVLQNSVVAAAVATVTADASTISAAVASLPAILVQTKYSREFEAAADDFAFSLLKRNGYSPAAFASIMERLAAERHEGASDFSYLSTHPLTAERIERARESAESETVEP